MKQKVSESHFLDELRNPSPMRAAVRFPLHLPVQLRTDTGLVNAITEDISSTGALFLTNEEPLVGSLLEWNLHLPSSVMGTSASVQVDCVGRVVWTRREPDGVRLGALIDHYELKDQEP